MSSFSEEAFGRPRGAGLRRLLCIPALLAALPGPAAQAVDTFTFAHENILGTSLELAVAADSEAAARQVEQVVLAEIARLDRILGTYRPDSEINRLAASTGTRKCSPELLEVLQACETWRRRTGGAFNAQLGEVIALWQQAGRDGRLPPADRLAAAVRRAAEPAFRLDPPRGTVTWLRPQRINLDAIAKGYVIDRAVAAAAGRVGAASAICLNVGGDIRAWNRHPERPAVRWPVRVADPANPAENAPPISKLELVDGAVATSGSYARFRQIAGRRYSHILDGRTGRPVTQSVSATVLARDCATADVLATVCMLLPSDEALAAVAATRGAECLLVAADGRRRGTGRWAAAGAAPRAPDAAGGTWPDGHLLEVSLTLTRTKERPMGAFWIEDSEGRCIRTLAVWFHKSKYLKSLSSWYGQWRKDPPIARGALTRATPAPGVHTVVWDGKDRTGRRVGAGTYTVRIELYERKALPVKHIDLSAKVACDGRPVSVTVPVPRRSFVSNVRVRYGP